MYTSMMRKALFGSGGSGDTALLSLDFTTSTMPTDVTFTRADTTARATFIDASGYVKTVTAAGDPRFDYVGGVAKGLLVEATATNLLQRSNAMNQNPWFETANVTRTNFTGGNGPDNVSNSGSKVSAVNIASGNSLYYNGTTTVPGTTYTYSVWAKADGANWIWIQFFYFGVYHGAFFDLSGDGALGNTTGTIVAGSNTITKYPNGWFRLTISHTATYTIFYTGQCPATSNGTGYSSILGQSPNGVLVYGAQVEESSSASSYISTTSAALTRLADDAVIRSTAWTSLYAQPGAMVVEFYRGAYGAGDRSIMSTDTTAARHWHLKQANASATAQIAFSTGSPVTQTGLVSGLNKVALAWNAPTPTASFDLCVNGATPTFGGSNVGTTLSTWLTLGSQSTTGVSGTGVWNGYLNNSIKSVKYYTGLTYAEMIAKTT
jgi:hypothetical protein